MDATLIANINDATATSAFLSSQRQLQDIYDNYNSYLYTAQTQYSNGYMSMKQRVPMVIEYYQTPDTIYTVEMYINPNKINFSHQKLIGKSITRGGIFFHHYGEDTPTMAISGNTGMSGMKGIEQLERIFNYSGTLLRYQNVGINKIDNGTPKPREILRLEDYMNEFDEIMKSNKTWNDISDTTDNLINNLKIYSNYSEGLLSEQKMAEIVGMTTEQAKKAIELAHNTSASKIIISIINEKITQDTSMTWKQLFEYTLKTMQDVKNKYDFNIVPENTWDELAFGIAYTIYSAHKSDNKNLLKNIETGEVSLNNTISGISTNAVIQKEAIYCDIYKCDRSCHVYQEPSHTSNIINEAVQGGNFTVTATSGEWLHHINGGWALKKCPDNMVVIKTGTNVFSVKEAGLNMNIESNKFDSFALSPGGFFTYVETKNTNGRLWYKHSNGGWVDSNYTEKPTYFTLIHENALRYTCIRDGVYLYSQPNYQSNKIKVIDKKTGRDTLWNGGLYTAIERQGDWIKWINQVDGQDCWAPLMTDGQANFKEGYTNGDGDLPLSPNGSGNGINSTYDGLISITGNDITLAFTDTAIKCTSALQQYLTDVRLWNKNSVVKRFEIESGLADIQSELTDEWLPRLIFIYFEDRVFLGHFDKFSYDRVAETENIAYNMTFVIHRIISVTSIDPNRFQQGLTEDSLSVYDQIIDAGHFDGDYEEYLRYLSEQYALGNDLPLKIEILRTRCKFYKELTIARYTGVPMTQERQDEIHGHAVRLRALSIYDGRQQINEDTPIFGNTEFGTREYLAYMKLQYIEQNEYFKVPSIMQKYIDSVDEAQTILNLHTKINGDTVTPSMLLADDFLKCYQEVIEGELIRVLDVWNSERSKPEIYTATRRYELCQHVARLVTCIGARYYNNTDYKALINNFMYWYNNEFDGGRHTIESPYILSPEIKITKEEPVNYISSTTILDTSDSDENMEVAKSNYKKSEEAKEEKEDYEDIDFSSSKIEDGVIEMEMGKSVTLKIVGTDESNPKCNIYIDENGNYSSGSLSAITLESENSINGSIRYYTQRWNQSNPKLVIEPISYKGKTKNDKCKFTIEIYARGKENNILKTIKTLKLIVKLKGSSDYYKN